MVEVRNPRARAWFVMADSWGWEEHAYLAPVSEDPVWYTEGAQYWGLARARLLGPGIHLARLDVSLRDNYRDSLWAGPIPFPERSGQITYNADLARLGSAGPPWVRLLEHTFSPDGSYHALHSLSGFPRIMRGRTNEFIPDGDWQKAYNFYRLQLIGDPNNPLYPPGRFGFKAQLTGQDAPPRFPVTAIDWADGYLYVTAPGVDLVDDEQVYLGGRHRKAPFPFGLYFAIRLDADNFAVPVPVGPWDLPRGLYARPASYKFVPYQNLRIVKVNKWTVKTQWRPWTWRVIAGDPVPINPCGMVMAWGRGPTYQAKFRFYHDSDVEHTVQWEIAQPNAEVFPEYHAFTHSLTMDRPSSPWSHVGEVEGTRKRDHRLAYSDMPGVCYTGTPEQWADGCSIDDPVGELPACCLPPALAVGPPVLFVTTFVFGTTVMLTVDQFTGLPAVANVTEISFDDAAGLVVSDRGPGHAGVSLRAAGSTFPGLVTSGPQSFGGLKTFVDGITVAKGAVEGGTAALPGVVLTLREGAVGSISPSLADGEPFWDPSTHTLYVGIAGVAVAISAVGTITVQAVDGTPTVAGVHTVEADQASGLDVVDMTGGVAKLTMLAASPTQNGVVTTGSQSFLGQKTFESDPIVHPAIDRQAAAIGFVHVNLLGTYNGTILINNNGFFCSWQLGTGLASTRLDATDFQLQAASGAVALQPTYSLVDSTDTVRTGATGTGGAGDLFSGGICYSLAGGGGGPSLTVGTTGITGGAEGDVLTISGGKLGAGLVTNPAISDGAVSAAKIDAPAHTAAAMRGAFL